METLAGCSQASDVVQRSRGLGSELDGDLDERVLRKRADDRSPLYVFLHQHLTIPELIHHSHDDFLKAEGRREHKS